MSCSCCCLCASCASYGLCKSIFAKLFLSKYFFSELIVFWHLNLDFSILLKVYHHFFFRCAGLDPSCYRGSSAFHDDGNDALLGGQAQMIDEERFKVG